VKWIERLVHRHQWHIKSIFNDPMRAYINGNSVLLSYWMLECETCGKLRQRRFKGHYEISKGNGGDRELSELKKLAGIK